MITGFFPPIVWWKACEPTGRVTSRTPCSEESLRNFCAHVCPCSSPEATRQGTSLTGWPPMPPSFSLRNFTAAFAATEPSGKLGTPPSSLMKPKVIGDFDVSAAPGVPPTNFDSWDVALSRAAPVSADALEVEPLELELELELESLPPHAATARAATRHAAAAPKPRLALLLMNLSSFSSTLPRGDGSPY